MSFADRAGEGGDETATEHTGRRSTKPSQELTHASRKMEASGPSEFVTTPLNQRIARPWVTIRTTLSDLLQDLALRCPRRASLRSPEAAPLQVRTPPLEHLFGTRPPRVRREIDPANTASFPLAKSFGVGLVVGRGIAPAVATGRHDVADDQRRVDIARIVGARVEWLRRSITHRAILTRR